MRYHDFHLAGYEVRDYGSPIALHLVYDYPGQPKEESLIEFSEVGAYHFVHTGGAIITDLAELPISDLLERVGEELTGWCINMAVLFCGMTTERPIEPSWRRAAIEHGVSGLRSVLKAS